MELNAVISKTLRGASIGVIKKIQVSENLNLNNFVVVPDRFSFQAEKLIFESLKIKSTFNINVVSVSKLSNLVLKLLGKEITSEKQINSALLVYSILLNNKDEFKTFASSKIDYDLAKDLYLILAQFKSSGVLPENLALEKLDDKLSDILLLYKKYEELKNENLDANDVLNVFASEIENSDLVKNSNFYFLEFDALTKQVFEVLKNLVKNAKSVTVGVAFTSKDNEYIYEKDIFNKLSEISNSLKIRINSEIADDNFSPLQKALCENLFSLSKEKVDVKEKSINVIGTSDESEEIKKIVEIINFEVKNNNRRYGDFNIVLPNISGYENELEKYFTHENIPYFIDTDFSLASTLPIKFLNNFFNFYITKNTDDLFEMLCSVYSNLSSCEIKKIISLRENFGLSFDEILEHKFESENINRFFDKIKKCQEKCEKIKKISNLIDFLKDFFEIFDIININKDFILKLQDEKDLKNFKIYEQIEEKFENLILNLSLISFEEEIDLKQIVKIFNDVAMLIKISIIPLAVDCVFVGCCDVSYFEEKDVFIFVGSNQGVLPKNVKDVGILNDNDILNLKKVKVEPSVKMLNRRNKFKLFCDACLCKERLYLLLLSNSKQQENEFVVSVQSKFTCGGENVALSNDFYTKLINGKQDVTFKLASKFNENYFKNKTLSKEEAEIENAKKTFFKNNSTSITKVQDYFKCPFYAFASHALKIKDKEGYLLNELDVGNILHKFCELYEINKKMGRTADVASLYLESINSNERTKLLYENGHNTFAFERLVKEAKALALEIDRHEKSSNFSPFKFEESFSLPLTEDINLVGKIDRIDKHTDKYRIIDYKTGSTSLSLSSLYYGLQIQLPVYMNACERKFGKCLSGTYFPINPKSVYAKNCKLSGYFINDKTNFALLDKNILQNGNKSDVLDVTFKGKEDLAVNEKAGVCTESELDAIKKYSEEIAKTCVKESLGGKFSATPCDSKYCENCFLYKLCSFKYGENSREQGGQFENSTFLKILDEEE